MNQPHLAAPDNSPAQRGRIAAPLAVVAASIICFLPCLGNEFLTWDDVGTLFEVDGYRGLAATNLRWMFTTFHMGPYQPLSWLTYAIDFSICGLSPFGFHLTNILWHTATALVLYFVATRLIRVTANTRTPALNRWCAALAALLFAVHPLRVESVAWATERRDVLSGFWFVAAVWAFLVFADSPRTRRWGSYALAFLCGVLATLSKATALTLPLTLLILDVYPLRRLGGAAGWFGVNARRVWLEKIPFVLLAVAAAVVAAYGQETGASLTTLNQLDIPRRFAVAAYAACFYLYKTTVPAGLGPMYELPLPFDPYQWRYILAAGLVFVITLPILLARRRFPALAAAWFYYLIALAPTSGLVHVGRQIAADRYTYLPMMGFAVLIGGCVAASAARPRGMSARVRIDAHRVMSAVVFITLLFGMLTWRQISFWHDSLSLWMRAIAVDPRCAFAHYSAAPLLAARNDLLGAVQHAGIAAELRPDDPLILTNYGIFLEQAGRTGDALDVLQRAAEGPHRSIAAASEFASALYRAGRYDDAWQQFQRALQFDPNEPRCLAGLGMIHIRRSEFAAADECLDRAVQTHRLPVEGFHRLADAWIRVNQPNRAAAILKRGRERFPSERSFAQRLQIMSAGLDANHPTNVAQPIAPRENPPAPQKRR